MFGLVAHVVVVVVEDICGRGRSGGGVYGCGGCIAIPHYLLATRALFRVSRR